MARFKQFIKFNGSLEELNNFLMKIETEFGCNVLDVEEYINNEYNILFQMSDNKNVMIVEEFADTAKEEPIITQTEPVENVTTQ